MNNKSKEKKPIYKRVWFWFIIIILILGVFGIIGGEDDKQETVAETETMISGGEDDEQGTAIETETKQAESITLTFGELGDYGTNEMVGEKEYIAYHIPAGTYSVTNKGAYPAQISIYKDGTTTNDDGIEEQILGDQKPLLIDVDASDTLTINDGEYLELYDNEIIELVLQ